MDEVMMTNNYRKYIVKDGTVDICRAFHRPGESIRHIISDWSRLANGDYLHRHKLVARIIHQQLALKYSLVELEVPYCRYVPDPVLENGNITLYWDRSIITDRTIVANKTDIVVIDRLERCTMIIDIAVPHDENLVKAEKDKQIKYLDLAREVVDMWDVDTAIVVPIVVTANAIIAKSLDQHLKRLSLGSWIKEDCSRKRYFWTRRVSLGGSSLSSPDHRYPGPCSRYRWATIFYILKCFYILIFINVNYMYGNVLKEIKNVQNENVLIIFISYKLLIHIQ